MLSRVYKCHNPRPNSFSGICESCGNRKCGQINPNPKPDEETKLRIMVLFEAVNTALKAELPTGTFDCPKCPKGVIRYYRSSNGHTKGCCSTEGCLSWIQ